MTRTVSIVSSLVALAAAFAAAPAVADMPMTVTGQSQVQELVTFADLDLSRWSHQQMLRGRVHKATERVCAAAFGRFTESDYGAVGTPNAGMSCADLAYDAARSQIADAILRARSGQSLALSSLTVRALAR